jgi:hypothetical protein
VVVCVAVAGTGPSGRESGEREGRGIKDRIDRDARLGRREGGNPCSVISIPCRLMCIMID